MIDPFPIARPFIYLFPPECAHTLTMAALKTGINFWKYTNTDPRLQVTLWDRRFPSPIGLAAGFDKSAGVLAPMLQMGFGFVEAGTVTPRPQSGNPRPRIFRNVEHEAVINRMGFPGEGMHAFKQNLEKFLDRKPRPPGMLGINIGMNKDQSEPAKDYTMLIRVLGPYADYLAVNISSPNTPGLRNLQDPENLKPLLESLLEERRRACGAENPPPLLVKLAPDLEEAQQQAIAAVIRESGIDGLILTNTTRARPEDLPETFRKEEGGLSGRPLKDKSLQIVHNFYRLTEGKIPIVGVGGVSSAQDAYAMIRAGASLVQIYSALIFQGPRIVRRICEDLPALLEKDGFTHISEAVGADHK